MPKRGSKAASRRARQRPPRRPVIPQSGPSRATAAAPTATPEALETAEREVGTLETPRPAPRPSVSGPSGLGDRARAEYHYVGRDLRNIAILAAVMVVLLVAAWLVLPATGIVAA
jgi:hypothetical protein